MSYLRLVLVFLLLLVVVLFASSTTSSVQLSLALTPLKTPPMPLSAVMLITVLIAYFAGVVSRMLPLFSLRRRLKRTESELADTRTQLRNTMQQLTALQLAATPPAYPQTPPPSPPPPPPYQYGQT
jgi:uncharacterized integral membrane protein